MKIKVQTLTGEKLEVEVEEGSTVEQLKVRCKFHSRNFGLDYV